jgi:hypothetical protein
MSFAARMRSSVRRPSSIRCKTLAPPSDARQRIAIASRGCAAGLDLVHPAVEKVTLVLEGIGAGKVRVNSASLDHPFVILAGEALEIVGIEKKVMMGGWPFGLLARP